MRFRFIEQHARTYPVRLMCRVLEVSPSGYYAWRSRPESPRALANRRLLQEVHRLHAQPSGPLWQPERCTQPCEQKATGSAAAGSSG